MTLLELLVKKLPEVGGWPAGFLDEGIKNLVITHNIYFGCDAYSFQYFARIEGETVTREQYEAALATSQHPVWDGEGLPPVGVECNGLYDSDDDQWLKVRIIAHDGDRVIGRWLQGFGEGTLFDYVGNWSFRPILTKAERKREETIEAINMNLDDMNEVLAASIYDAIAAGKIPGVKLDSGQPARKGGD